MGGYYPYGDLDGEQVEENALVGAIPQSFESSEEVFIVGLWNWLAVAGSMDILEKENERLRV